MTENMMATKIAETALNRPKVFLRRITDPWQRLAVQEYILNRKKKAARRSLENMLKVFEWAN